MKRVYRALAVELRSVDGVIKLTYVSQAYCSGTLAGTFTMYSTLLAVCTSASTENHFLATESTPHCADDVKCAWLHATLLSVAAYYGNRTVPHYRLAIFRLRWTAVQHW